LRGLRHRATFCSAGGFPLTPLAFEPFNFADGNKHSPFPLAWLDNLDIAPLVPPPNRQLATPEPSRRLSHG
jgi:hypothetical protein